MPFMRSPLGSISAIEIDEESGAISVLLSAPPATYLGRPAALQGEVYIIHPRADDLKLKSIFSAILIGRAGFLNSV